MNFHHRNKDGSTSHSHHFQSKSNRGPEWKPR